MTSAPDASPNHANHANTHVQHASVNESAENGENTHFHTIATDDLALEHAIGDAFKQFAMFGNDNNYDNAPDAQETTNEGKDNVDHVSEFQEKSQGIARSGSEASNMDLENVVGNLFASLSEENGGSDDQISVHDNDDVEDSHNLNRNAQNPAEVKAEAESKIEASNAHSQPLHSASPDHTPHTPHTSHTSQDSGDLASHPCNEASMDRNTANPPAHSSKASPHSQLPLPSNIKLEEASFKELEPSTSNDLSIPQESAESTNAVNLPPTTQASEISTSCTPASRTPLTDTTAASQTTSATAEGEPRSAAKDDEDDLQNAIGDAFKNLASDMTPRDPEPLQSESQANEPIQDPVDEELDDLNLEDAIGAAFQSLAHSFETSVNHEVSQAQSKITGPNEETHSSAAQDMQSEELSEIYRPSEQDNDTSDIDLGDIVQSVVSQIGNLETSEEGEGHSKSLHSTDDFHNSSSDTRDQNHQPGFTNKHNESQDHTGSLPSTQGNSNSDDLDAALKAAVANAVKSAFPTGNTNVSDHTSISSEKDSDLEHLQMNEILQNAFSMAMQDPQQLLHSLDAVEKDGLEKRGNVQNSIGSLSSTPSSRGRHVPAPFNKTEEPRLIAHLQKEQAGPNFQKPLSIAQTLALHRANMSTSQRDYSAIKSLEDSVESGQRGSLQSSSQKHSQLSTILSSLSQHIKSGNHSSNLMSVIRQMTNAFMSNKKLPISFYKGAQDALKHVKNSEGMPFYLSILRRSNQFVLGLTDEVNHKEASILIENIIEWLDSRKSKNNPENLSDDPSVADLSQCSDEDIAQIYSDAVSSLSALNIPRLRMVINGVKPDLDSTEHKTRVREGNRERKKKWREENAERNKDNDLRCRVMKRASIKFGESSSDAKSEWIENEYLKRKTRRQNRQKKEDVKAESPPPSDDTPYHPIFSKRVTEIFNLVTECGVDEDPRGVFMAVSSTMAIAALFCAKEVGITDNSAISDSMTQILNSIFDQSMRSGATRRFVFLARRADNSFSAIKSPQLSREDLLEKMNSLKNLDFSGSSMPTFEALRETQKRLGIDFGELQSKRQKMSIEDNYSDADAGVSNGDDENSSTSLSANLWNTVGSLRMPSYKTPSSVTDPELFKVDHSRRELVEPIPKIASPFISNKLAGENSSPANGIKKGGNLQRPGFAKRLNKPNNLGFPTLYSTTFRSA